MAEIRPSGAIEAYILPSQSTATSGAALPSVSQGMVSPALLGRFAMEPSESQQGVLRGLHYHHRQVDYWHCGMGALRVGLLDLRCSSPTRGQGQVIELDQGRLRGVFIPAGVAHGFYAVTDAMLFYLVDSYYDGTDEWGVAWDDPDGGLDWGIEGVPILSPRDQNNPQLRDIPAEDLPN